MDTCDFCMAPFTPAYAIESYDILRCVGCGSFRVAEMPTPAELAAFYDGFLFQAQPAMLSRIATPVFRDWMARYLPAHRGRMLDVGGGGGFFAAAFERFGLGEATYIDLDPQACDFARTQMGLSRVICDSVENLSRHVPGQTFDFIYCRHVIEHLVAPAAFVRTCARFVSEAGTFVVHCPCGSSKEAMLYPRYWWKFLKIVQRSNNWRAPYAWWASAGPRYGWGIAPLRHLWAVTPRGLRQSMRDESDFTIRTFTASLSDAVWSPYWPRGRRLSRLTAWISQPLFGPIFQGAHLVAEIRRA